MIKPAIANLTCAITNGWDESKAILVAVDAEAHKKANRTPAPTHLYFFFMVYILILKKEQRCDYKYVHSRMYTGNN